MWINLHCAPSYYGGRATTSGSNTNGSLKTRGLAVPFIPFTKAASSCCNSVSNACWLSVKGSWFKLSTKVSKWVVALFGSELPCAGNLVHPPKNQTAIVPNVSFSTTI